MTASLNRFPQHRANNLNGCFEVTAEPKPDASQAYLLCQNNWKLTPSSTALMQGLPAPNGVCWATMSQASPLLLCQHLSSHAAPAPKMSRCAALQSIVRISPALRDIFFFFFATSRNMSVTASILPELPLARASSNNLLYGRVCTRVSASVRDVCRVAQGDIANETTWSYPSWTEGEIRRPLEIPFNLHFLWMLCPDTDPQTHRCDFESWESHSTLLGIKELYGI